MIYTHLAAALIAGAMAATGAWQVQNWRYGAMEKNRVEQELVDVRLSAASAIRRIDNVVAAQNAARVREVALHRDADLARSELERLRVASESAVTAARTTHEACIVTAATQAELFQQCGSRYTDLARKADGHVNDIQTLNDSWPTK